MRKLRRALLVSCMFSMASMLFLFASYIHSAVAHEPQTGAAITVQKEEIIEIIIFEHDVYVEPLQEEILEPESDENIEVVQKTKDPEVKVVEILKKPENRKVEKEISTLTGIEVEIHTLSNAAREKRGRAALVFDKRLAELARTRSSDMLERDYFSHTSPEGCGISCNFAASDYDTLMWAENIARYEPYDEASMKVIAEIVVEKWLKSSRHRDNLLSGSYTHHGVGVAVQDERIVVTVLFATP